MQNMHMSATTFAGGKEGWGTHAGDFPPPRGASRPGRDGEWEAYSACRTAER